MRLGEYLEIVHQGAHPRGHLFFLGPRQETDVLAHRHGHPGHDDLLVAFVLQGLFQAGGERQQGLACTGHAHQRDKVDFGVHQQVERKVLLAVVGGDAPHPVA